MSKVMMTDIMLGIPIIKKTKINSMPYKGHSEHKKLTNYTIFR